MQNKGLVKLFAVLFGLVSIYQLSFTFKNSAIEKEATEIAASKFDASAADYIEKTKAYEVNYLDSLSSSKEKVFLGSTYAEVKANAMKLGLDLKGGLEAILQVSVKDILKGLANNTKDPIFNKALDDADELQKDSQNDYIDDFYKAFDAIKGDAKLASPDIFATRSLVDGGDISIDMTDNQVKKVLSVKIDESINSALQVLRTRIDQFGVASPSIQRLGTSGRILVELPGVKDVERAKELITSTAQLEFWEALKGNQCYEYFNTVNTYLKNKEKAESKPEATKEEVAETEAESVIGDLTGEVDVTEQEANPLLDLVKGVGYQNGPVVYQFNIEDKAKIIEILAMPEVKALRPLELREAKFVFGKPVKGSELVELYALKGNRDNVPPLAGGVVTDARQEYSQSNKPVVSMQMNPKGAKIWEELTDKSFKNNSEIAIVLDNTVYSAPGCRNGKISGGRSEISGDFSLNEATDLANVLRAGKLPARAEIIQSDEIGPTLGAEAIQSGKMSFIIALLLVLVWMIVYYGKAGIYADIAMLLNIHALN